MAIERIRHALALRFGLSGARPPALPAPETAVETPSAPEPEAQPPVAAKTPLRTAEWRDDFSGMTHRLRGACEELARMPDQHMSLAELKNALRLAALKKQVDDYKIVCRYLNNTLNGKPIFETQPEEPAAEEMQHCNPYALSVAKIAVLMKEMLKGASQHYYENPETGARITVADIEKIVEKMMVDMTDDQEARPGAVIALTAALSLDAKTRDAVNLREIIQKRWTASLFKTDYSSLESIAEEVIGSGSTFPDYHGIFLQPAQTILKIIDGRMTLPGGVEQTTAGPLAEHVLALKAESATRLLPGPGVTVLRPGGAG